MRISLSEELLKFFLQKELKIPVQILKINKYSTLVSIRNKELLIPYPLKNNIRYTAEIKNGYINLFETKIVNKDKIEHINKFFDDLDKLFKIENKHSDKFDDQSKIINFHEFINNFIYNIKSRKYKKNFLLKKDEKIFFFIFEIPFFFHLAKVFIKIEAKRNIYVNFYVKFHENIIKSKKFTDDLKNSLKGRISSFIIKLTDNKNEFYNDILLQLKGKNIDINI